MAKTNIRQTKDELKKQKAAERAAKEAAEKAAKKKERALYILVAAIAVIILAAMAVSSIAINARIDSGVDLRENIAATSATYELDNAIMSYFLNSSYQSVVSYYGSALSSYGLDTTRSLKSQEMTTGYTWFDYFADAAKSSVTDTVALAEAAKAEGIEVTEAEKAALAERAAFVDTSYYGRGVNKDDVLRGLELSYLAIKYENILNQRNAPTMDEINAEFNANSANYQTCDYYGYSFSYDETNKDEMLANADALAATANADEFIAWLKNYIKTISPDTTDEQLETLGTSILKKDIAYASNSEEVSNWLFSASVGDTKVVDNESSNVSVYMLAKEATIDESETKSFRHILFSTSAYGTAAAAKAKADEIFAQFNAGDKSMESFEVLTLTYSQDSGSSMTGGLYENIEEGAMATEINAWLFDESRKDGDLAVVETTYGAHIMLYCGDGLNVWQASVSAALVNEALTADIEEFRTTYPVTFNDDVIADIPA